MILGIILILIGVIGVIATLIYGIKFMKKNDIIIKSDYVDIQGRAIEINNDQRNHQPIYEVNQNKNKESKKTKNQDININYLQMSTDTEVLHDTQLLDDSSFVQSDDTELLGYNVVSSTLDIVTNDNNDTEILM